MVVFILETLKSNQNNNNNKRKEWGVYNYLIKEVGTPQYRLHQYSSKKTDYFFSDF